jgi:glycosyltransferase involved in cell wall biosynthesis
MNLRTSPLVSLAIPVFNGAQFMRFAIDSALAQTYPHVEIIVVNDGSNDGGETEKIALSYGGRVKYYYKSNGGVGSALNLALSKSSGEYFCWLSHDDQYLPDKVLKEVHLLQSLPTSGAVVYCRHGVINANGELLHELPPPPVFKPDTSAYQLLLNQWLHCCTVLAPRTMYLEMGGFREDLPTTQDYDLLMKMGLRYPFFEVPEVLLFARSHPKQGSLTEAHRHEVERFFYEHIPMLSLEYMCQCFSPSEIFDAWVALGVRMREKGFAQGVMAVFRQLIECEIIRSNPTLLLDAISRITLQWQAEATQWQAEATQWQAEATQWQAEATQWQAEATQLSIELGKCRSSWRHKLMDFLTTFVKRIFNRFKAFDCLYLKSRSDEVFSSIYKTNYWRGESRSGEGSDLIQTQQIREIFPSLLKSLGAKSMLDIPCGDYYWMQHVDLPVAYTGADIVQEVVNINNRKYSDSQHKFLHLDVCNDKLPQVDLIFARDLLVHLSYNDIRRAIKNMKESGATWLLTTTFTGRDSNIDIKTGDWRTLNLQLAPFNFPEPEKIINEGCTQFNGDYSDKSLGLWKIQDLEFWL